MKLNINVVNKNLMPL